MNHDILVELPKIIAAPRRADAAATRHREDAPPRLTGAAIARARGASNEDGARWSFQTGEYDAGELDNQGREGYFVPAEGRDGDFGSDKKRTAYTAFGARAALGGAVLMELTVIGNSGIMNVLTASAGRMAVRRMIVRFERSIGPGAVARGSDHWRSSPLVPRPAYHHAGGKRALDGYSHQQ